ncbi:hypothetical protein [Actinoplanes derwentensis]|uniref:hypothetical protein n=1 Tax=Actinoplanes derwentensis TaxID=113562 RepID=UPI000ABA1B3A|nr:hypothetical protein [Actinoplanes derwentensis]GID90433.1 hypothetical protein Ade03nite_93570 [Actinoplanes derwentensis]
MLVTQYYLDCLSQASYLIANETTGQAVLADARAHGLTIAGVINTHFHAGHLEVAAATGAWMGFGRRAETEYPIRHFTDSERISLGDVTLQIMETPRAHPRIDQRARLRTHRRRAVHR